MLTEVEFHTGLTDDLGFACRLLRKAYRQGVRVQVTAPAPVLSALDRELWVAPERDFVPHVLMPGSVPVSMPAVARRTPIWLGAQVGLPGAPRVLVNLGADAPAETAALDRLIEIVSADPDEAERGRERWRAYKMLGLRVKHHAPTAS